MKVHVRMTNREEVVELTGRATPQDVMVCFGLLPDAHIVLRDRSPIPIDELLFDGESIRIIKVASGG